MKTISILVLALGICTARAQTINAVYFGQTHVLKPGDSYFGLVGSREALIKVHVTAPATPASPAVTATLTLNGQILVLPLTGPATLPASIPDGPGVVQHSYANTFTAILPAAWVKKGLQVTVNAGTASTSLTNLNIGAPTKVLMTMFDVQYFSDTNGDYPANTFAEIEAKWPVADLEVRRLGHIVFPELVIPPRTDVGTKAARIKSKAEYSVQTGLPFDGEQAAALAWNGALKRAAGRSGRWSLYYLNVYNAFAGGQAGGFAGVGNGTSVGILHHELGHALSLPHWGDSAAYPYKGDMFGIQAPIIYNDTHAGPTWAFDLRTRAFIPPTTQAGNAGGKPVGTYKADPMQGGGNGWQEPAYLMNHFSDYSVNQMRNYLQGHVVVWNQALNSYASWNQTAGDYTSTVTNNGVQYPTVRDTPVISILASISGSDPGVTMLYPPIGPYTAGLIRLFDPTVAADRTAAQSIFSPTNGSDLCVRVVQGGVTKTYMLAASWVTNQDPYSGGSLVTEAINLPAAGGAVTKIDLLLTPNVEDVGLPANPQVLSTWAPLTPEPASFETVPKAYSNAAIAMKATAGAVAFGYTGTVEYMFTETTGNPGATSSAWQTSRSYTDTGLQAGTQYSYTVSLRAGSLTATTSVASSATTLAAATVKTATVNSTQQFSLPADLEGFRAVTGLGTFNAGLADKLVVVVSTEDKNNGGVGFVYDVRYNGKLMIEAIQEHGGSANGAAAIFYLDNPGPIGTGTIEVSAELPNGGIGAAYALSNTMDGVAVTNSRSGNAANSVSLTTAGTNSVAIAVLENSGNPNTAGTPTATAPLTQVSSGSWGSAWGSHASGYQIVATPSALTPTFSTLTGGSYSINIAAAEFPADPPQPNVWVQTAGGTQNWTTTTNWDDGVVPAPTSTTTMDFSTVNIAASITLNLGANRTAEVWKFGDTSGTETWTVNAGNSMILAGPTPTIEVVNNSTQLNCLLTGSAGLVKSGAGALILTASNTYTGGTTLLNGTLTLNNASAIGTGLLTLGGSNNPALRNDSGTAITLPGNNMVWAGNFRHAGNGLNFGTGNVSITANATQDIVGGTLTVGGVVSGNIGINKLGIGTLVFNGLNTFTGGTVVRQGTMIVNTLRNFGVPSSLGAPASGSIAVAPNNSSTLSYTGTGDTTNRPIQVGGIGSAATTATVSNSGTGALVFTAVAFNTPVGITAGSSARNLALSGTFGNGTTPNEVQGVIADNTLNGATAPANRISLIKSGTGAWKLSSANTYSGTTSITAGTLILGLSHVLPDTTSVSIGAATLDADTRTDTAGTLDVTGAATLRLGSGAALRFADSSAIDWTGGTLAITGTFVSGSSLRFGASASALNTDQLALISKPGGGAVALDSNGYLIHAPANAYASWATTNAPSTTPDQDQDGDHVSNAVEFVLGGTALTNDASRLPAISASGGNLLFSFQRNQASINATTTVAIQVGTTLLTWPDNYNVGADTATSSAGVTVLKGVPSGFDTVTLSVPQSPGSRKFVRLNITITP